MASKQTSTDRGLPLWKGNIVVFGLLFLVVLGYSYRQTSLAKQRFLEHVRGQAPLIAEMIRLNTDTAEHSRGIIVETVETLLSNTGRFVDYLDQVEPFSPEELAAFAGEAGLAGIRIVEQGGTSVEGPPGWYGEIPVSCSTPGKLVHEEARHVFVLTLPRRNAGGCVAIGIDGKRIEELQAPVALPRLIKAISSLPGIGYIREVREAGDVAPDVSTLSAVFVTRDAARFAEVRFPIHSGTLAVGLKAEPLFRHIGAMWRDFVVFNVLLALSGGLLSWLLYRQQTRHVNEVRSFEQDLSRIREEAALGRAAAAIAHEVRNPLNALAMGLQRLRMEATELTAEHRELLSVMKDSIRRTDGIVGGLLRYARPREPVFGPVRLDAIADKILTLYQEPMAAAGIELTYDPGGRYEIEADRDLIEQVVENLIKNAVEAQPEGGRIRIALEHGDGEVIFAVENGGFDLDPEERHGILEPYYTTKTRGTGLGLAIASRIVRAHGGRMDVAVPRPGEVRITFALPVNGPAGRKDVAGG